MDDKLLDIGDLFNVFKKKFWIIIVITIITTGLGLYKTSKMIPSYQGNTKVFVGNSESLLDYYGEEEIQYYNELMNIFNEIIRVDDFLNDTLKKKNINKSAGEVKGGISIAGSERSPIYTISYSSMNEDGIEEIIKAISSEFTEYIKRMIPETNPKEIDEVRVTTIMPNKTKLIIVAFGIGLILSIGLILVLDYLDDTIKSKEKLEKLLPIPVIGEIPKHEKAFKKE